MAGDKPLWSTHKNDQGRVYWSNSVTKQSVWEKPDELKTPFEVALSKTEWKQYVSKDRPYYVSSKTKETVWELPADLKRLKRRVEREEAYEVQRDQARERGEPSPSPPVDSRSPSPDLAPVSSNALTILPSPRTSTALQDRSMTPFVTPQVKETVVIPMGGFLTYDKAEAAFIHLLRREGVDETWTWDQTMRKIIMDPLYKALDTLAEKKAAFEKFTNGIVSDRRAAKDARITKLRPILQKTFAANQAIRRYSTIKTADIVFSRDRHWRELEPDERRMLLDEYVTDLGKREEVAERELRGRNIQALGQIIRNLGITVSTRWRAAHDIILTSNEFKEDKDLQQIEMIDILDIFDDYSRQLEQEYEVSARRQRIEDKRKGRKARDAFRAFLHELREQGDLTRSSKWKETLPKIQEDERYTSLLGLPGSSPLDMWMDAVDDLGEEAERAAEKIERAIGKEGKELKSDTTWEEFEEMIRDVHMDSQLEVKLRREVYDMIHVRLSQIAADEARRMERKRRHRIDDLRYAMKKVSRHLETDMTYEEAVPHIQDLSEFKDIPDEEDRRAAFDRYVRKQKERLRDAESSEVGSTHAGDRRVGSKEHRNGDAIDVDDRADRRDRAKDSRKPDKRQDERDDTRSERDEGGKERTNRDRRPNGRERERPGEREREPERAREKDRDLARKGDTDRKDRAGYRDREEPRSSRRDERGRDRNFGRAKSRSVSRDEGRDRSKDEQTREKGTDRESDRDRDKDGDREDKRQTNRGGERVRDRGRDGDDERDKETSGPDRARRESRRRNSASVEPDDRDLKRRRVSPPSATGGGDEVEEGEI